MTVIEFPGQETPRVHLNAVGSDLRLRGWHQLAVSCKDDSVQMTESEEGVAVTAPSDLSLRVAEVAEITGGSVGSDAKISDLIGLLTLENIGGDASLRQVGSATFNNVGGDLRVKRAAGDITIKNVGGDAIIREIDGNTTLGSVGGDLYVRDVNGACEVAYVGGDLLLSTRFMPGMVYTFKVQGDVVCRIPVDADVRFRIPTGLDLAIDAPGAEIIEDHDTEEIVFGSGAALVELDAEGDVQLVAKDEDYMMAINFQLEEDMHERFSNLEERVTEQLSGLDELIAKQAEKIREKAELQAERAARKAERAARKLEKKGRKFAFSFGSDMFDFDSSRIPRKPARPPRPPEPVDPVSDDERLMILRMVETKQISVEEAEKLLAALEGR